MQPRWFSALKAPKITFRATFSVPLYMSAFQLSAAERRSPAANGMAPTGVLATDEEKCGKAVHGITSHTPKTTGWRILHADG